ncbi:MAG: cell division protein FtsQ [Solirubrobacteraceae bacterium]|jgi:cell division protein FtsQ|nr:Cell division septal protein-like protein [Solirubrobacterales bacterium]MEA2215350.1 cell division protein FtsQ [Solirubrobacteraceae bacterium]
MDRSFAARSPAGRRGTRRAAAPGAPAARSGLLTGGIPQALSGVLRAIGSRRRLRIASVCLAVGLPVLGGGWLWLRHSSFVAVEHIRVTGVHGPEAHAIQTALRDAAKGMSTLDAKPAALKSAVSRFPAVSEVRAIPSFPHSMRIEVTQLPAVAALLVGGTRTAVAGDGTVLGPSLLSSTLPSVADDVAPGTGAHLSNTLVLQALAVLGAAPAVLDRLAEKAYFGPRGLTVAMRNGLLVYFGDATRPHAKWLSLASVLADKSSAGAKYVDVRLPGRPAAGFAPGTGPSHTEEAATGETQRVRSESTIAALAAGLARANPETSKKSEGGEEAAEAAEPTAPSASSEGEESETATSESSGTTTKPGG